MAECGKVLQSVFYDMAGTSVAKCVSVAECCRVCLCVRAGERGDARSALIPEAILGKRMRLGILWDQSHHEEYHDTCMGIT